MRLTPHSNHVDAAPSAGTTLLSPNLEQCAGCGGHEVYALTRPVDHQWLSLRLCRRCDRHHTLVIAIDEAIDAVLAE